jgi:hypothetical protein
MLNLATQTGVLESLLHRVFSDLERQHSMRKICIAGFVVDRLQPPLKSFAFTHETFQLILVGFSQLSHV